MKKIINILFIAFTICLTIFPLNIVNAFDMDVAKIGEKTYSSLYDAVSDAKDGDTVEVLNDSTETNVIVISSGITINGNGHMITFNLTNKQENTAFSLVTSNKTIINNIKINASVRGITINNNQHDLTLNDSTLTVNERAITLANDSNKNSTLTVNNCIMSQTGIDDYEKSVPNNGNSRGISLWQLKDSTVSLNNTTIQGFTYVINTASQDSFSGTKLIIDNCTLRGRAGLNIWDSDMDIELKNSEILGINNQSGQSEGFANIVLNESATNTKLNIVNTKFLNYQNEVGMNNSKALQYMMAVRSPNNVINISSDTSFYDTTKKLDSVFENNMHKNDIQITGGTYSYDVSQYVKEGYQCKLTDGYYKVSKILNSPKVEIEELDLNKKVTDAIMGTTNLPLIEKVLLNTLLNTKEVDITNKNVKVRVDTTNINPSETVVKGFNDFLSRKNMNILNYFDISVKVIDVDTNNIIGNLTELDDKVTFTVLLPDNYKDIKNGYIRKYYIVREHNNNYEILDTKLSDNKTSLTFETDKFSTYSLAYYDEKIDTINNPATYDKIELYLIIGTLSFVGLVGTMLYLRRKSIA